MSAIRRLVVRYDRLPQEMRVDDGAVRAVLRQDWWPLETERCRAAVVVGLIPRVPTNLSGRLYLAGVQVGRAYRCTKRREGVSAFCRFHRSEVEVANAPQEEVLCAGSA